MSAAAPTVDAGAVAPAKRSKKKLVVMLVIALLVVLAGGGGAIFFMKKKAHDAHADEAAEPAAEPAAKRDSKHAPTFLPLDPFVVNLADKEAERYAQVGITLEVEDPKFAEDMKAFMPAIRNGILMILAHKTSGELLERSGKERLAGQIQREAARSMGIEVDEPSDEDDDPPADGATEKQKAGTDEAAPPRSAKTKAKAKAKARRAKAKPNPVRHVHFSNFIIQ